jgi:DNA-directed RNA polymerase specialized sigma24 family protein
MNTLQSLALSAAFGKHAGAALVTISMHAGEFDENLQVACIWAAKKGLEHVEKQAGNWVRVGVRNALIDFWRQYGEEPKIRVVLADGKRSWELLRLSPADEEVLRQHADPDGSVRLRVETERGWAYVDAILNPYGAGGMAFERIHMDSWTTRETATELGTSEFTARRKATQVRNDLQDKFSNNGRSEE